MHKSAGQSILEVVVAVGIIIMLTASVAIATASSLRVGQEGKNRSLAVKYAQEGIELTRVLRDAGWTDFLAKAGSWCLDKTGAWTAGATCSPNIDAYYTRMVSLTWNSSQARMEVAVTVSWYERDMTRQVETRSYLTQWR